MRNRILSALLRQRLQTLTCTVAPSFSGLRGCNHATIEWRAASKSTSFCQLTREREKLTEQAKMNHYLISYIRDFQKCLLHAFYMFFGVNFNEIN